MGVVGLLVSREQPHIDDRKGTGGLRGELGIRRQRRGGEGEDGLGGEAGRQRRVEGERTYQWIRHTAEVA